MTLQPVQTALKGRRDCMGIPIAVNDTVEFIDGVRAQVVGFIGNEQFIYSRTISPLALQTHWCKSVVIVHQ